MFNINRFRRQNPTINRLNELMSDIDRHNAAMARRNDILEEVAALETAKDAIMAFVYDDLKIRKAAHTLVHAYEQQIISLMKEYTTL